MPAEKKKKGFWDFLKRKEKPADQEVTMPEEEIVEEEEVIVKDKGKIAVNPGLLGGGGAKFEGTGELMTENIRRKKERRDEKERKKKKKEGTDPEEVVIDEVTEELTEEEQKKEDVVGGRTTKEIVKEHRKENRPGLLKRLGIEKKELTDEEKNDAEIKDIVKDLGKEVPPQVRDKRRKNRLAERDNLLAAGVSEEDLPFELQKENIGFNVDFEGVEKKSNLLENLGTNENISEEAVEGSTTKTIEEKKKFQEQKESEERANKNKALAEKLDKTNRGTGVGPQLTKKDLNKGKRGRSTRGYAGTGELNKGSYFPSEDSSVLQGRVSVGKYNLPIFAANARRIPFGLIDAREKALNTAATNARKEYKSPEIKNKNYQQKFQDQWYGDMKGFMDNAFTTYGTEGAERMLNDNTTEVGREWERINNMYTNLAQQFDQTYDRVMDVTNQGKDKSGRWFNTDAIEAGNDWLQGAMEFKDGTLNAEDLMELQQKFDGSTKMSEVMEEYKTQVDASTLPAVNKMIDQEIKDMLAGKDATVTIETDADGNEYFAGEGADMKIAFDELAAKYGMDPTILRTPGGYKQVLYAKTVEMLGQGTGDRVSRRIIEDNYYDVKNSMAQYYDVTFPNKTSEFFEWQDSGDPQKEAIFEEVKDKISGDLIDMYGVDYEMGTVSDTRRNTYVNVGGNKKKTELSYFNEVNSARLNPKYGKAFSEPINELREKLKKENKSVATLDDKRKVATKVAKTLNGLKIADGAGTNQEFFRIPTNDIHKWTEADFKKPITTNLFSGKTTTDKSGTVNLTIKEALEKMDLTPDELTKIEAKLGTISKDVNLTGKIMTANQVFMDQNDRSILTWDDMLEDPELLTSDETNTGVVLQIHIGPDYKGMPMEDDQQQEQITKKEMTGLMKTMQDMLGASGGGSNKTTKTGKVVVDPKGGWNIEMLFDLDNTGDRNTLATKWGGSFNSFYSKNYPGQSSGGKSEVKKKEKFEKPKN